ncbi:hypothetical protein EVG20_g9901 [Dentipellis fragilis]|uniref:Uncharacterized protein n=1 Tax=Dentipellis fragilis TaxID=205917 RepID=A0A4Y9XUY2_9AGAM|nr:hypothetical protein EVG20_g9901 [Dentipellis fragilis]
MFAAAAAIPHIDGHATGYEHSSRVEAVGETDDAVKRRISDIDCVGWYYRSPVWEKESGCVPLKVASAAVDEDGDEEDGVEVRDGRGSADDEDAEPDELEIEPEPEREHEHEHGHESDCLTSRANSPVPPPAPVPAWRLHEPYRPPPRAKLQMVVPPHLDLAGACFDPCGQYLYVASTGSVVEWSVRGAEKRWWGEGRWA